MSGRRKFSKDHNSERLFCNGVPVRSRRFAALYVFSSLFKERITDNFKELTIPHLTPEQGCGEGKAKQAYFYSGQLLNFY